MTSEKPASGAYSLLGMLLALNLFKYIDRQVLYSLLPLIKEETGVTDAALGLLATAFVLVYMGAAPLAGFLADRGSRRNWIAGSAVVWSIATAIGALGSFALLLVTRCASGLGQSGFSSAAPAAAAEPFPKESKGMALALFSLAIPVGSALGYILGGWIGHNHGWRTALVVLGLPGILPAALAWKMKGLERPAPSGGRKLPKLREYLSLYRVRSYLACSLAMAMMTFALGGLAVWMPTFFVRFWGMDVAQAGILFGGVTIIAGLVGSLAGGWLGDRLLKITGKAYFLVSGVGLILALPLGILAILSDSFSVAVGALLLAEILIFLNTGPLNAVIVSVTEKRLHSMAFAANIFVIHAFGDAISPTLIGLHSDRWGLRSGLVATMCFLGISGLACLWGSRFIEADTRKMEETLRAA